MDNVIRLYNFYKKKEFQKFLRLFNVVGTGLVIGILVYALVILEMQRPMHLPSYIESKAKL